MTEAVGGGVRKSVPARMLVSAALLPAAGCGGPEISLLGKWEIAEGTRTPTSAAGWTSTEVPFSHPGMPAQPVSIVLRRSFPGTELRRIDGGYGLTLYGGIVSDVSRFDWNGVPFASTGSREPYRSGAAGRVLAPIPDDIRQMNELRVSLFSPGEFGIRFDDRNMRIAPTEHIQAWYALQDIVSFAMLGVFCVVGFGYLVLFARRRTETQHLFFGLFCLLTSMYWFLKTGVRELVVPNPVLRYRLEFSCLFLSAPLFAFFVSHRFAPQYQRAAIGYGALCLALFLSLFLGHYLTWKLALWVWEVATVFVAGAIAVLAFRHARVSNGAKPVAVGVLAVCLCTSHDILLELELIHSVPLSRCGLAVLVCGLLLTFFRRVRQSDRALSDLRDKLHRTPPPRRRSSVAGTTGPVGTAFEDGGEVESQTIGDKTIVYTSAAMRRIMEDAEKYAALGEPVLLTGETGTGKELIAQYIHESSRPEHPFVAVNCAAIPSGLWEDEVFGHVAGAYTDAHNRRAGLIQRASSGTLFFDEVGEMPLEMQAKMLRILQERVYSPVGADEDVLVECRLVYATNRPLETLAKEGQFRSDLLYRINVLRLELPPLRERREDIPHLVALFLDTYLDEMNSPIESITREAIQKLRGHDWPGNVRELQSTVLRALAVAPGPHLEAADLQIPKTSLPLSAPRDALPRDFRASAGEGFQEMMAAYARAVITAALAETEGNISKAARLLQLQRSSMDYRMKTLGIRAPKRRGP